MSATRKLARQLCARLERLHQALLGLGQRLRESIAGLIGSHIGEAVREAIRAMLDGAVPRPPGQTLPHAHDPYRDPYRASHARSDFHPAGRHGSPGNDPWGRDPWGNDHYEQDPYSEDACQDEMLENGAGSQPGQGPGASPVQMPELPALPGMPRWWSFLPAALQLADWWLRRYPGRPRLVGALVVGAAAAITAVTAGPLAGAVTAVAGTAVLLTSLADGSNNAVAELAQTITH
jgi:hypothetical protein